MVPDRQKVRMDGRKDGRNGRTDEGRTDDAKTISLRLRRGIIKQGKFVNFLSSTNEKRVSTEYIF